MLSFGMNCHTDRSTHNRQRLMSTSKSDDEKSEGKTTKQKSYFSLFFRALMVRGVEKWRICVLSYTSHWTRTNGIYVCICIIYVHLLLCWYAYTHTNTHIFDDCMNWRGPLYYEQLKKLTKTKLRIAFLQSQIIVKCVCVCVFFVAIGCYWCCCYCRSARTSMSEHPSHIHLVCFSSSSSSLFCFISF